MITSFVTFFGPIPTYQKCWIKEGNKKGIGQKKRRGKISKGTSANMLVYL